MYADKTLTCVECGSPFVFSADDQEFHARKGFTNEPKRCPTCRARRRAERGEGSFAPSGGGSREMFPVTCANCGREALVPFQPRGDKPVYCNDCFQSQRQSSGGGYGRGRSDRGDYSRSSGSRW